MSKQQGDLTGGKAWETHSVADIDFWEAWAEVRLDIKETYYWIARLGFCILDTCCLKWILVLEKALTWYIEALNSTISMLLENFLNYQRVSIVDFVALCSYTFF